MLKMFKMCKIDMQPSFLLWSISKYHVKFIFRLVKLLKETYGHDNVAARADQISVRLEENSALINTNTKVGK